MLVTIIFVFKMSSKTKATMVSNSLKRQKIQFAIIFISLNISPFLTNTTFNTSKSIQTLGILFSMLGVLIFSFSLSKYGIGIKEAGTGLQTSGIYGFVRHPMYSGAIMIYVGTSLINGSAISILYLPIVFIVFWILIIIEEKCLLEQFGEDYSIYQQKVTSRMIPFLF